MVSPSQNHFLSCSHPHDDDGDDPTPTRRGAGTVTSRQAATGGLEHKHRVSVGVELVTLDGAQ